MTQTEVEDYKFKSVSDSKDQILTPPCYCCSVIQSCPTLCDPMDCSWNPTQVAVFLMKAGDGSSGCSSPEAQYLYLNSKAMTLDTLAFTSIHGLKPK